MNKEQYQNALTNVVALKTGCHVQKDMPAEYVGQKRLYAITTIDRSNSRCVAVASSFDRAVMIVERNEGDVCEGGTNGLVVIEPLLDGVMCAYFDEQYWYGWDGEKYVDIERPQESLGIVGWGVG